jgi:hypothetical protein
MIFCSFLNQTHPISGGSQATSDSGNKERHHLAETSHPSSSNIPLNSQSTAELASVQEAGLRDPKSEPLKLLATSKAKGNTLRTWYFLDFCTNHCWLKCKLLLAT